MVNALSRRNLLVSATMLGLAGCGGDIRKWHKARAQTGEAELKQHDLAYCRPKAMACDL